MADLHWTTTMLKSSSANELWVPQICFDMTNSVHSRKIFDHVAAGQFTTKTAQAVTTIKHSNFCMIQQLISVTRMLWTRSIDIEPFVYTTGIHTASSIVVLKTTVYTI